MAYQTGIATDHYDLHNIIRTFVATQGWTELEYNTTANSTYGGRYSIWRAPGLSGTEQIYTGLQVYQSVADDVYNFQIFGYTGYVNGTNPWQQPGIGSCVTPLYNQSIPYWMICNGQRLAVVANIQNVDVILYTGKFFPYATPGQYPYPMYIAGMMPDYGTSNWWRYSSTREDYFCGYKGYTDYATSSSAYQSNSYLLKPANSVWDYATTWFEHLAQADNTYPFRIRNTNNLDATASGDYGVYPVILMETIATYPYYTGLTSNQRGNIYGELDGIFRISGYNNATKNIVTINSVPYLVFRDKTLTAITDYYAMRLQ